MVLLTKELIKKIPKLYQTEDQSESEKLAQAKLFLPGSQCTWYVIEYDGNDQCFGLVDLGYEDCVEYGYFSLRELSQAKSLLGLGVERDLYFKPTTLEKIRS